MPQHLNAYYKFKNNIKCFVFHKNNVEGIYGESCMLTDKNIFFFLKKTIESKSYVCERKMIKQGCQTDVKFEGAGVKKGT